MTKTSKDSVKGSNKDLESDAGSTGIKVNKTAAILCPPACALLLVTIFAATYLATRFAWNQYDAYCARKYDFKKLYVFPDANITLQIVRPEVHRQLELQPQPQPH